jgi:hypothetical protein
VKDVILMAMLTLGLATLVTAHVSLVWRLFRLRPRWRALAAVVVPPLGVIWALRAGWKGTVGIWLGAVAVYLVALIAALAGVKT